MSTEAQAIVEYQSELLNAHPELRQRIAALIDGIPTANSDAAPIVEALLNAESEADYNAVFESEGLRDYLDSSLTVLSAQRAPSDFRDGIGFFLILKIRDPETGKDRTITTGSIACVVALGSMQSKGQLPAVVVPVESERPTRSGYTPLQLRVMRLRASTAEPAS